jgi:hypothetical protein
MAPGSAGSRLWSVSVPAVAACREGELPSARQACGMLRRVSVRTSFRRVEASIALRARPAISVLNGSEHSTRLVYYSHDLPFTGTFQTAPPPAGSKVLVSLRYSSLSNGQTPAICGRPPLFRAAPSVHRCSVLPDPAPASVQALLSSPWK